MSSWHLVTLLWLRAKCIERFIQSFKLAGHMRFYGQVFFVCSLQWVWAAGMLNCLGNASVISSFFRFSFNESILMTRLIPFLIFWFIEIVSWMSCFSLFIYMYLLSEQKQKRRTENLLFQIGYQLSYPWADMF